jgi:hypothetical protein
VVLPQITPKDRPRAVRSVAYTVSLDVEKETVWFVARRLAAERRRPGTRTGTRWLSCYRQAVLVLAYLFPDIPRRALAGGFGIPRSTTYAYRDEGIKVLAGCAPGLDQALAAATAAGHTPLILDGTLIPTDKLHAPGPTAGVDAWWSGKHHRHGGNVQVLSAPDGWPIWVSPVVEGRSHDTSAVRRHTDLLTTLTAWCNDTRKILVDLGYQAFSATLGNPYKTPKGGKLTDAQQAVNALPSATRCLGERANALLKGTFRLLQHWRGCPRKITQLAAAALTILHVEHRRAA